MFDRQQIMRRTWEIMGKRPCNRINLRNALTLAWHEAKEAARRAQMTEADLIQEALNLMDNKNHLTEADHAKRRKLLADLGVALAHEKAAADYEVKRAIIANAKARFVSITFTKQDGTRRVMRVQPSALRQRIKGNDASKSARQAALTRARRHPNLLPVWDADEQATRSVNLATVSRIAADGTIHQFAK